MRRRRDRYRKERGRGIVEMMKEANEEGRKEEEGKRGAAKIERGML